MAKVFTITEGLQNMGALKTGGQGSVYKGVRVGEIITAVKLLPTPIFNESKEDKNFKDFQNEVEKLRTVNREPNPNVVKILGSGLTETGNFPFIEMEFIEGPDLEELLKPPHDPVFMVKEVIKVADHLSNALAHCHRHDVKHGDIKSNNVKFNIKTGNYVLLDFGLAVMTDEQRRTSLRHAGAVEFMAPEQNEGAMLLQSDIYSFGVVLFELLTGQVPFPLQDKSETARNAVRLAHIEGPVPDIFTLRKERIPAGWVNEKKGRELHIPDWLLDLVYKCLQKKPEERFATGIELRDFIVYNSTHIPVATSAALTTTDKQSIHDSPLLKEVATYKTAVNDREKELYKWTTIVEEKEKELQRLQQELAVGNNNETGSRGVSKASFAVMLLVAITVSATSALYFINNTGKSSGKIERGNIPPSNRTARLNNSGVVKKTTADSTKAVSKKETPKRTVDTKKPAENNEQQNGIEDEVRDSYTKQSNGQGAAQGGRKYGVVDKAYFHNSPDETTRRNAYIVHWNKAVLTPLNEQSGFIYVIYTNEKGQISKGWLRKKDLKIID